MLIHHSSTEMQVAPDSLQSRRLLPCKSRQVFAVKPSAKGDFGIMVSILKPIMNYGESWNCGLLWIMMNYVMNELWMNYEWTMNELWKNYEWTMNELWIQYSDVMGPILLETSHVYGPIMDGSHGWPWRTSHQAHGPMSWKDATCAHHLGTWGFVYAPYLYVI